MRLGFGFLLAAMMSVSAALATPNVLLLYDNIGEPYFTDNVTRAGRALGEATGDDLHVVVYHKREKGGNIIYELVRDARAKNGFRKNTLKTYAADQNDSFSGATLTAVVGDMRSLVPGSNYGFAFGSHGMGWIPKSVTIDDEATDREVRLKRYFTSNEDERLDVGEFAAAMGRWKWDFIIFDDCYMASVEALYEMRGLADFFVASSAEILLDGFSYDRVVKTLAADWRDLPGVAREFVDYYRESTIPDATGSVIATRELDALAATVRAVVHADGWKSPDATGIQSFEGLAAHIFFDLDDYLRHGISTDSAEYGAFAEQLHRTVVFADATATFTSDFAPEDKKYPITRHSGLTSFILWSGTATLRPYYAQTAWYKAVF